MEYLDIILSIDYDGFPYGNKDLNWLKNRLIKLIENSKAPIVILACNTLSSLVFYYDLKFEKTIVDVITPTIYFLRKKKYENIAILSTKNTKEMGVYSKLLHINIEYIDVDELITEIQGGIVKDDTISLVINKISKKNDAIVLGCTHLIKIKDKIREKTKIDVLSQDEIFVEFLNENI